MSTRRGLLSNFDCASCDPGRPAKLSAKTLRGLKLNSGIFGVSGVAGADAAASVCVSVGGLAAAVSKGNSGSDACESDADKPRLSEEGFTVLDGIPVSNRAVEAKRW